MNKEVSIGAWIVSLVIGYILYVRNRLYDRWNAIFLVTFTTIQLIEGGLWFSVETGNTQANRTLTKFVIVALFAQPLVQTYFGYLYTGSVVLYYFSFVFLGLFLWAIYLVLTRDMGISQPGKSGYLVWGSLSKIPPWVLIVYITGLFLPLIIAKSWSLFIVGVITAFFSWLVNAEAFASLWCLTSCAYGVVALVN